MIYEIFNLYCYFHYEASKLRRWYSHQAKLGEIMDRLDEIEQKLKEKASREYVKNYKPLDRVEVKFDWDRKTDLSTMAYTKAKEQVLTFEEYNEQTGEVVERTEYGTLYGWRTI